MTSPLPEWMRPPRPEGWVADDLDTLSEAPRHTELIDGALVFMMSPQRAWHSKLIYALRQTLTTQTPAGLDVYQEMTIRLDRYNRPEPDVLITRADYDPDRTFFTPDEVVLVVEVVSPESAHRDRTVKLSKYAGAGIPHYWRVEDEPDGPAVYAYELDTATGVYAPAGIYRQTMTVVRPFPLTVDLTGLIPPARKH